MLFITRNANKFKEAKEIFGRHGIEIGMLSKEYVEVQAKSLGKVVIKALQSIEEKEIFIEDAGLFIKFLKGFPGVYSKYVEETIGNEGILRLMGETEERNAVFISVVGFKDKYSRIKTFKGKVEGRISRTIRGKGGFGFDPIFIPKGFNKTFAEDIGLKMEISHRKRAMEKLARYLKNGKDVL
jgi:XTP/dITP diphosphohydrolase